MVANGPYVHIKIVESKTVIKAEDDWDDKDLKRVQLNAKAISLFYNALSVNEYNRIIACETAKQIWDKLEITYEGSLQVKESKIDRLVHQFETFKMQEHESIVDMMTCFTHHKFIKVIRKKLF